MDTSEGYSALRHSAAVYARGRHIVEVSGPGRQALLSHLLARPTEYAQPGTVVESLVLSENGIPVDIVIAVFDEMRVILLSDLEDSVLTELAAIAEALGIQDATVRALPTYSAVQVEGPAAGKSVSPFVDEDLAGVLLYEWRTVTVQPSPSPAVLARTGTTAEYGYLIIAQAPSDELTDWLAAQAGGQPCSEAALVRARLEVNHPIVGAQFDGVSVLEAGAGWLGGLGRQDDYRGKAAAEATTPHRRLIAVESSEDLPPVGTKVYAGDTCVGAVHVVAPRVGQPTSVGLALLDMPFDVPGLELRTESGPLATISRPAVEPVSWLESVG